MAVILLLFLFLETHHSLISAGPNQEGSTLFITENITDNNLATALNQSLNSTGDIIDIRNSDDLNDIFLEQNYLNTYSRIIMILNQVNFPFNESLVDNIEQFIQKGGIFCFISHQIWHFPASFHTLLGLSVSSGQKEWPPGNNVGTITMTIVNETFTKEPFQFRQNTTLEVKGSLGITTAIDDSFRIAESQNTPDGKATITGFVKQEGYILAVPFSLNEYNSSFIPFNQFLTSALKAGIEYTEASQPQSSSETLLSSSETTQPHEPPLLSFFSISEETVQAGVVIVSVSGLLIGLAYMITKWVIRPKDTEIPKDRDLFSVIFLTPLLLIGQIIFPPILRRIDEYDVVENQYRNKIVDMLEERDFMHFRELKRELNIGTSSLRWHLQVLEDFRMIKRKVFGQYEIFFLLKNEPNPAFLEIYFAIISGLGFRVAKAFQEMNSWNLNALTDYLGSSKESIRYHTKKFQKINLIELKEDRYYLDLTKHKFLIEAISRRQKTS